MAGRMVSKLCYINQLLPAYYSIFPPPTKAPSRAVILFKVTFVRADTPIHCLYNKAVLWSIYQPLSEDFTCSIVWTPDPTREEGSGEYRGLQVVCQRTELGNLKMSNQNWGDVICDGSNWSVLNYNCAFDDKGLANHCNLARKCLAGMPRSLNSATFLFQISNAIGSTIYGQILLQFSKFLCSTVCSLPVISLTRTLVGWSDVRSLINTDGSIPALKTLPGKVFSQTLPRGLGLGSRLSTSV